MTEVIISYSHKYESWKDRLVTQLRVMCMEAFCDVWDDKRIEMGDTWRIESENSLNETDIDILLIIADFLNSKFICTEEIPKILGRRENGAFWVIPLFMKTCPWIKVDWLSRIQGELRDGKSMEELDKPVQVDKMLAGLAEKIADRINASAQKNNNVDTFNTPQNAQPTAGIWKTPLPIPILFLIPNVSLAKKKS